MSPHSVSKLQVTRLIDSNISYKMHTENKTKKNPKKESSLDYVFHQKMTTYESQNQIHTQSTGTLFVESTLQCASLLGQSGGGKVDIC